MRGFDSERAMTAVKVSAGPRNEGDSPMRITKALLSTAYHEAGHAVAAQHSNVSVESVTIVPSEDSKGVVKHHNPVWGLNLESGDDETIRMRCEAGIMVCFAGEIAQRRFNPRGVRRFDWEDDREQAIQLADKLESGKAVDLYLAYLRQRTKQHLEIDSVWKQVAATADALVAGNGTLSGNEFRGVFWRAVGIEPLAESGN